MDVEATTELDIGIEETPDSNPVDIVIDLIDNAIRTNNLRREEPILDDADVDYDEFSRPIREEEENRVLTLEDYLEMLPLAALPTSDFEDLLNVFLETAFSVDGREAARRIMELFEASLPKSATETSRLPFLTSMFMSYQYSDEILSFLVTVFPDVAFEEHVIALINYDEAPTLPLAMSRIFQFYKNYNLKTIQDLFLQAESIPNQTMMDILTLQIQEMAPAVIRPPWVRDLLREGKLTLDVLQSPNKVQTNAQVSNIDPEFGTNSTKNESELYRDPEDEANEEIGVESNDQVIRSLVGQKGQVPLDSELAVPEPVCANSGEFNPESLARQFIDSLENIDLQVENRELASQLLEAQLRNLSRKDQDTIVQNLLDGSPDALNVPEELVDIELLNKYADDETLFRIVGPLNRRIDASFEDSSPCAKYGGCRMFICIDFEAINPEDDTINPDVDWYTGSCQYCFRKIVNRYWAIRRPLVHGGWVGCYCSSNCIKLDSGQISHCDPDLEGGSCPANSLGDPTKGNFDPILNAMLEKVAGDLDRLGIQDRRMSQPYGIVYPPIIPNQTCARNL